MIENLPTRSDTEHGITKWSHTWKNNQQELENSTTSEEQSIVRGARNEKLSIFNNQDGS